MMKNEKVEKLEWQFYVNIFGVTARP